METETKIIIGVIIIAGIIIYIYKDDIKTYFDYKKDSPKIDLIKNKEHLTLQGILKIANIKASPSGGCSPHRGRIYEH